MGKSEEKSFRGHLQRTTVHLRPRSRRLVRWTMCGLHGTNGGFPNTGRDCDSTAAAPSTMNERPSAATPQGYITSSTRSQDRFDLHPLAAPCASSVIPSAQFQRKREGRTDRAVYHCDAAFPSKARRSGLSRGPRAGRIDRSVGQSPWRCRSDRPKQFMVPARLGRAQGEPACDFKVPTARPAFDNTRQKCAIPYPPGDLRAPDRSTTSRAKNAGSPANRASTMAADGARAVETPACEITCPHLPTVTTTLSPSSIGRPRPSVNSPERMMSCSYFGSLRLPRGAGSLSSPRDRRSPRPAARTS